MFIPTPFPGAVNKPSPLSVIHPSSRVLLWLRALSKRWECVNQRCFYIYYAWDLTSKASKWISGGWMSTTKKSFFKSGSPVPRIPFLFGMELGVFTEWDLRGSDIYIYISVQFTSVAQSCPTLCDPMNHSTPGLPVHHQLPEFTQTHVHQVSDAIQPSHPLSSPSPPAPNPSQHHSLFQWVNSSHEVAKILEFQL